MPSDASCSRYRARDARLQPARNAALSPARSAPESAALKGVGTAAVTSNRASNATHSSSLSPASVHGTSLVDVQLPRNQVSGLLAVAGRPILVLRAYQPRAQKRATHTPTRATIEDVHVSTHPRWAFSPRPVPFSTARWAMRKHSRTPPSSSATPLADRVGDRADVFQPHNPANELLGSIARPRTPPREQRNYLATIFTSGH